MQNVFESPFRGIPLSAQVTNPNIIVGRYSYYSGYYHGHGFDDCARYLMSRPGVDRLIIGSFCSIGSGASFIMAGNQGHRQDWISTFPFFYLLEDEFHPPGEPPFSGARDGFRPAGDTVIGHDVWIGAEAMIMPGIKVGHGAVIGARAVVTRDVESYAVVAGNPAKPIRKRFSESDQALLIEMRWWDWTEAQLREAMPLLTSGEVAALHQHWRVRIAGAR